MWTRKLTARKFWLLFSLFLFPGLTIGADSAGPLPAKLQDDCARGFRALYSMDYQAARKQFEQMIQKDSKHPAGYIYLASVGWLEQLAKMRRLQTQIYNRGNAFFSKQKDPVDPAVEKLFYGTMEKGIIRANMRLRADKNDLAGLYYIGTAHGAIAGYESTVKRTFFSSLQHGTEAVEAHRKIVKNNPHFADAYVSLGMYNYVVGKLPTAVKILMLLGGVRGSKEEGLKQLEKAMNHGHLAQDEAAVILVVLYDREKRPQDALNLLLKLSEKYPSNPVFRFESATMMTKVGRDWESLSIYEKLLKEKKARDYLLDFIHFEMAEILFARGDWQTAYEHFLTSRRVTDQTPMGMVTISHLRAGQCLNALGKNEEAVAEYNYVLKQPDIQNSRKLAKQYLKSPWTGTGKSKETEFTTQSQR